MTRTSSLPPIERHRPPSLTVPPLRPKVANSRTVYAIGGWLAVYAAAVVLREGVGGGPLQGLILPSVVALAFSLWAFLRQGGTLITSSSIYSYSTALFLAFPALYAGLGLNADTRGVTVDVLLTVLSLSVLSQAVAVAVCRSAEPKRPRRVADRPLSSAACLMSAGILVLSAVVLRKFGYDDSQHSVSGALTILAVLLSAEIAFGGISRRARTFGFLLLVPSFMVYYQIVFTGFGRLTLGTLGLAIAVFASIHRDSVSVKVGVLVATAPAIVYLAYERVSFLQTIRTSAVGDSEGIGSVVGPFISLGKLGQAIWEGRISPTYGSTFWSAGVFWIPRSVWPSKPTGFGSEIIYFTQPSMIGQKGFSDAGTIVGELLWNFGPAAALGTIAVAVCLRWLDGYLVAVSDRMGQRASLGVGSTFRHVLAVGATSAVVNLVWGGTFSYVTRIAGLIAAAFVWFSIMRLVSSDAPVKEFSVNAKIERSSNRLRRRDCPNPTGSTISGSQKSR